MKDVKESVYLVGQISPKHLVTYEWRERVEEILCPFPEIEVINPCANGFNEKMLKKKEYAITKEKRVNGVDVIVPKDRMFVNRSSICMANMNQYDPLKPLIGSFYEMAWYYDAPEKAVIGFADDLENYTCQHPFVKKTVTTWCNNYEEACEIIIRYFLEGE